MLKLLSFQKPVVIDSNIVVNNLAYNHSYVKENHFGKKLYIHKGEHAKGDYTAMYDNRGEIFLMELTLKSSSRAMLPWKLINTSVVKQKSLSNDDGFVVTNYYQTTQDVEMALVRKEFYFSFDKTEYCVEFSKQDGTWRRTKGHLPSGVIRRWIDALYA